MNTSQKPPAAKTFSSGKYLFHEGDTPKCMYLIQKGTVAIRKAKLGGYVEIARIYPKEVLGELSFFDRQPRSASAVALNEVEALEISFESLDRVYDDVPDYMKSIIASLAMRLRRSNETIRRLQQRKSPDEIPSDIPADHASDPETKSE